MRALLAFSAVFLLAGCSSYEATIDVQIAPAEAIAAVGSGIYPASEPALAAAPRLPYRQASVDARFEYASGNRHTWHVRLSYAKDERLRWHGSQDEATPPSSVLVTVSAAGRKPVEARFPCGREGVSLDLVAVLPRAP